MKQVLPFHSNKNAQFSMFHDVIIYQSCTGLHMSYMGYLKNAKSHLNSKRSGFISTFKCHKFFLSICWCCLQMLSLYMSSICRIRAQVSAILNTVHTFLIRSVTTACRNEATKRITIFSILRTKTRTYLLTYFPRRARKGLSTVVCL